MISAFPKIFTLGQVYILDIFKDPVEVTEKVDGSQFNFGNVNGELFMRPKGKELFAGDPEKMFKEAIEYVLSIAGILPDNTIFHCEYLQKPKHNVLAYERTPKNHLILFGVSTPSEKFESDYTKLVQWSDILGVSVVPLLFCGVIHNMEELTSLLNADSILGNVKVEGVVCKNYARNLLLGGHVVPVMMGKFVSEKFKEVHSKNWSTDFKSKNRWEVFMEKYRSEARWEKAVQHLSETGVLEGSPRDIGKLLCEIQCDIEAESSEDIKAFLWKEFGQDLKRKAIAGFPEWYKDRLAKKSFEVQNPCGSQP